ncbi:hypothetical protein [Jiella pelagia]|uniref:hypothetical protein n=1 Tax=Jiella pelagia TaxID=2986949 RepID=UPI0038B3D0D6
MAARRERIEPSFDRGEGTSGDGLSISADDRAVPTAANDHKRKRKPVAKSAKGKVAATSGGGKGRGGSRRGGGSGDGGGGNGRRRRRSFAGHVVRLGIAGTLWGGLAVAAVVGYFAVKLPQEAWEIPARPPNVKIVSVGGEAPRQSRSHRRQGSLARRDEPVYPRSGRRHRGSAVLRPFRR